VDADKPQGVERETATGRRAWVYVTASTVRTLTKCERDDDERDDDDERGRRRRRRAHRRDCFQRLDCAKTRRRRRRRRGGVESARRGRRVTRNFEIIHDEQS
jgi:hypothetical protein